MDNTQLDELKQFIHGTVSEAETRITDSLRTEMQETAVGLQDGLRQELRDSADALRQEMRDTADGVRQELQGGLGALRHETQSDLAALRQEMQGGFGALRQEMHGGFGVLRAEMQAGFAGVGEAIENLGQHVDTVTTNVQERVGWLEAETVTTRRRVVSHGERLRRLEDDRPSTQPSQ
jgi:hypothetical protein